MKLPRTVRRFLIGYLILHMLAAVIFVIVLSRITRNQMIAATKSKMSAMTLVLAAVSYTHLTLPTIYSV